MIHNRDMNRVPKRVANRAFRRSRVPSSDFLSRPVSRRLGVTCFRGSLGLQRALCIVGLLALIVTVAHGQQFPPRQSAGQPAPGSPIIRTVQTSTTASGSGIGSSSVVRRTPAVNEPLLDLAFPDVEVRQVLNFYTQHTGKRLIIDNAVTGTVYIVAEDVPRSEAMRLIEITLLVNGFTMVPVDDSTIKVLSASKNARSQGVPLLNRPEQLPTYGEQIISYLVQLKYRDPTELQQVLTQSFPTTQNYSSILALPQSKALLITETSTVIKRILFLLEQIDTPPAPVDVYSVTLERADAEVVAELLNEIIATEDKPQPSTRRINPTPTPPGNNAQANADSANNLSQVAAQFIRSEESIVLGVVKITPDPRTNRIHIRSRPENMTFLRSLVAELDANVDFGTPQRLPLRYMTADEMYPILIEILTEEGEEVRESQAAESRTNTNQSNTTASSNNNSSGIGSGTQNAPTGLEATVVETSPLAFTIGNTRVVADRRSDAIIVMGTTSVADKVRSIIDQLDLPTTQVYIATVIGELTLSDTEEFGMDIFRPNIEAGTTDFAAQSANNLIGAFNPFDFETVADFAALASGATGLSGFTAFFNAGDTSFAIRALETANRFRTITRPRLVVENHQRGVLVSGQEIAVPVSTTSTFDDTTPLTSSSIQFRSISLVLEVVPHVTADNEVSLEIYQRLDNVSGSTTIDNNEIPNIATRTLSTRVRIPNGHTVVLGGAVTDGETNNKSGVLGLSRIPVIGNLFSSETDTKNRDELLILMTPIVIPNPSKLESQSHEIGNEYYMERDPVTGRIIPREFRRSNEESEDTIKVAPPISREEMERANSASERRERPENATILRRTQTPQSRR